MLRRRAQDAHLAGRGQVDAGQQPHSRRFAAVAGPDQPEDRATRHVEVKVQYRGFIIELFGQAASLDDLFHRASLRRMAVPARLNGFDWLDLGYAHHVRLGWRAIHSGLALEAG
jgi:hypothetical protein